MASQDDITDFNRRSRSVGAAVPIQEIPKLSEIVGSPDPTRLARMREWDRRLDEWRKSLITAGVGAAEKQAITTASVAAASTVAGPAGQDGIDGQDGKDGVNGSDGRNLVAIPPDQLGLVKHVWIAFRTDGVPGTGSIIDPFDGSTADKFDTVMAGFGTYMDIHIGPGVFETRGNRDSITSGGWYAKDVWRITGAGIDVTTLKLIDCPTDGNLYWIVGNSRSGFQVSSDFVEVSDLTCDCNLRGQPANVAAGGVIMYGGYLRCFRVRCCDWGTKAPGRECFVITIKGLDSTRSEFASVIIEACICDAPYEGAGAFANNSSILFAGNSGQDFITDVNRYDFNATIRSCIVDGTKLSGALSPTRLMTALTVDGRGAPIVEDNLIVNSDTGFYRDTSKAKTILIRNNRFVNVRQGILLSMGGSTFMPYGYDGWKRPYAVITAISSVTVAGVTTVSVTTSANHGLVATNWVDLRGSGIAAYDGVWKLATGAGSVFTYVIPTGSYGAGGGGSVVKITTRSIVTLTKFLGGTRGVVDAGVRHGVLIGSRVQVGGVTGADAAAYNMDLGLVTDVTDTTFTYQLAAVAASDAPAGEKIWWDRSGRPPDPAVPISSVGTLATVKTELAHNYDIGDLIAVSGVQGAGSNSNYNGYFLIESVPDQFHFTYRMVGTAAENTAAARYTNIWTVKNLIVELNYLELLGEPENSGDPVYAGAGIGLGAIPYSVAPSAALSIFENVLLRNNTILTFDGAPPGITRNSGIAVDHVRNLVCEDNMIEVDDVIYNPVAKLIAYQPTQKMGSIRFSNNRKYNGTLLRCYEVNTGRYYDEPERSAESALLLQAGGVWA